MSAVPLTGVGISWPTKLNQHTNPPQKLLLFLSKSHKPILKSPVRVCRAHCASILYDSLSNHDLSSPSADFSAGTSTIMHSVAAESLLLVDLDPATAKLAIALLGPFLSAFGFLFIARIVMSWYPKLPVEKFPYVVAYAPTEPLLVQTRKVIPPLAGVDVTPVVWFGLLSFLNEILVGPQGLLVLLSQQQV